MRGARGPAATLVVASLVLIAVMTLRPTAPQAATDMFCIFCGTLGGVDFVLNVILFVPLGIGLRLNSGRWMPVIVIGVLTTLVVETLQWRVIAGRDASLGDLLANTSGALLGAGLATVVPWWLNATGRTAVRLAVAFGIVASMVVTVSAALLQPLVPHYMLWVQWIPIRPNLDPFRGHLNAAEVRGRAVQAREALIPKRSFDTLARSLSVRVRIDSSPAPTKRLALIVRIANDLEEGFTVAQWGDAIVFKTYMAAARVRLRPILIGLDGTFAGSAGNRDTAELVVDGYSDPRAISLRRHPDGSGAVSVRRTVGLAWALFLPWDVALNERWWPANAIWLAILILPTSFFVARSLRTGATSRFAAWPALLVIAFLIAAPATGLSPLTIGEWAGVLAGIAAGWTLERWTSPEAPDLNAQAHRDSIPS